MFSVNVPVPGRVRQLASRLHPRLVAFDRVREEHTLVVKRLGDPDPGERPAVEGRVRRALAGTRPFEVRITGIDLFEDPPAGPGPVVYLAVEGAGLLAAHERLCEAFDPVDGLEGDGYVPHVTLARGGPIERARELADREVDAVAWTVTALEFHENRDGDRVGRIELTDR